MTKLTWQQARRLRLRAQNLLPASGQPSGPVDAATAVAGLQAQDAKASLLSLRARCAPTTAENVEHARLVDRSLVRTWVMRGTLHLLATADLEWLLPYLAPRFIRSDSRRRHQLGLDDAVLDRAMPAIHQFLTELGPQTRAQLAARLSAKNIPVAGQAIAHLVYLAGLKGILCFGPNRGSKPTYASLADWATIDVHAILENAPARLALRHLRAFGPATANDLAKWAGIPIGEARAGLEMVRDQLVAVDIEDTPAWLPKERLSWIEASDRESQFVRLLPIFDTVLLGYQNRDWILPPQLAAHVVPGGGWVFPAVLVDRGIAGTWKSAKTKGGLRVAVTLFQDLTAAERSGIKREAENIARFLGFDSNVDLQISP